MTTRVLLVRHGESVWNTEGRWQGQADPELSALGERQAAAAAAGITEAFDVIWASDLVRASRTAEVMAQALGLDAPRTDRRLRERDAGEWSGLTRAEIDAGWPGYLAERRSPPGFEPDESVVERALAALDDIADASDGGLAMAVSHGGVVRTVERRLGGKAAPVPNLGGRWVVYDDGRPALGERVLLIDPDDVEVTVPPPR